MLTWVFLVILDGLSLDFLNYLPTFLYSKVHAVLECVRMLETHPLLPGTYPIITSPWPGLWQFQTHYGIPNINASLIPIM